MLYYDFHYISLYTPQKVLNSNAITLDLSQGQAGLNSEVSGQFWLWSLGRLQARSFPEVLALHSFSQTSRRPIIVDFFSFFFIDFFQSLSCGFFFQKPWHSKRSSHGLLKTFLFPPTSFFHCLSVFPSCMECHQGTRRDQEPKGKFPSSHPNPVFPQRSRRVCGKNNLNRRLMDWKKRAQAAISVFWKKLVFNSRCSL